MTQEKIEKISSRLETLRKLNIVCQSVVIFLSIMAMFTDFRFHPIVVVCYATCILLRNLTTD